MALTLLALLAGVVALLLVPLDIVFAVRRDDRFRGRVTLGWLFGAVRVPVVAERSENRPATPCKAKRPGPGHRRRVPTHPWAMLRSTGFVTRVLRLLRSVRRCIRIRRLRLHVRLGLDDPADTGLLWGLIGPLVRAVPMPAAIAIEPEFTGEVLLIDGEGAVRIVPIALLAVLIGFALSPTAWRALRAMRSGR